jgi:hypothetical protein
VRARALLLKQGCEARVEHKPNFSNVIVCSTISSCVGWKVLYVFHKSPL